MSPDSMKQRPTHVPKFGNWDANDHMPYSVVFAHARAERGNKMGNPNVPSESSNYLTGRKNTEQESGVNNVPSKKPSKKHANSNSIGTESDSSARQRTVPDGSAFVPGMHGRTWGWLCSCFHPNANK